MRADDPEVTATEMARAIGISYQRVLQILRALGMPTVTARSRPGRPPGWHGGPRAQPRLLTGGVPVKVHTSVAGTIAELLVAADLYARGWKAFAPVGRHNGYYDLVAVDGSGQMLSIEVRCGRRTRTGHASFAPNRDSNADHHAVVITGEPVLYVPDLPEPA